MLTLPFVAQPAFKMHLSERSLRGFQIVLCVVFARIGNISLCLCLCEGSLQLRQSNTFFLQCFPLALEREFLLILLGIDEVQAAGQPNDSHEDSGRERGGRAGVLAGYALYSQRDRLGERGDRFVGEPVLDVVGQ